MSIPLRRGLFYSYLAILMVGIGVAALLTWRAVENLYLSTQRENLLAQAKMSAAALEGQVLPDAAAQPYSQTSNAMPGIHSRLLSEQGAVLIGLPVSTSDVSIPAVGNNADIPAEDLLKRPEIASAIQGAPSTYIRSLPSARNRRVLYAAAPVFGAGGEVSGLVYLAMPLPKAGLPTNWITVLAGSLLAAAALAIFAGTLIARRISLPMEAIAKAAASVSRGDYAQKISTVTRIRELNELSQAFNQMTESLRQSDQAKNAFIADVTHELRTPLTVIKGTLETLDDGALYDVEGRGPLLASMQQETDRLIRLVNDLLVLTRADAGTLNLSLRAVDLGELARARCKALTPLAERRQVKLAVSILDPDKPPLIMGDTDRLSQILDNLLDNATRYSPEGSSVDITIRNVGMECVCGVRDHGSGIAAKHLAMIFERFYRADASRNRQTGGAGLGLAIARALALAQGGRIWVESIEGEGTAFYIAFPACEMPVN